MLKNKIKDNCILYNILKPLIFIRACIKGFPRWLKGFVKYDIVFNLMKFLRLMKVKGFYEKYEGMLKMKNKHVGERCFVVATGPSLTIDDLNKLKNEITFSVNTIYKTFCHTDWRPTYFVMQDPIVYGEKNKEGIDNTKCEQRFIADWVEQAYKDGDILFPVEVKDNFRLQYMTEKKQAFSNDCYKVVHASCSVVYSVLQIAVYMGFKEIYILGCDCDYTGPVKHFGTSEQEEIDVPWDMSVATDPTNRTFAAARNYAERHGIKVFNATRGGKLEAFERVDLDDVLKEMK